jgi:lipopolysaccharide transport system permease protein
MLLNPMTAIIETFKYGAYGAGQFSWTALGYSALIIFILLFLGIAIFNRKQKYFIDTI